MTEPKFLTELKCRLVKSGWWKRTWELTAPLKYYSDVAGEVIIAPKGFRTDFASVPRLPLAWWLAGSTQQRPAVIHDWLYRGQKCPKLWPRKKCDRVFLEAMEVEGASWAHRQMMYRAVRLAGWRAYHG
jgi:hypothetical protein